MWSVRRQQFAANTTKSQPFSNALVTQSQPVKIQNPAVRSWMFLFLTQTEISLLDTQTLFWATIQPQQILVSKPGCVRLQDRNVTCSTRRCGEQGAGQNLNTCVSLRGFSLGVFQGIFWLKNIYLAANGLCCFLCGSTCRRAAKWD